MIIRNVNEKQPRKRQVPKSLKTTKAQKDSERRIKACPRALIRIHSQLLYVTFKRLNRSANLARSRVREFPRRHAENNSLNGIMDQSDEGIAERSCKGKRAERTPS